MTFIGVTSILFVLCFFFCIVHFLVLSRLPYVLVLLALNLQVGILLQIGWWGCFLFLVACFPTVCLVSFLLFYVAYAFM